MRRGRDEKKRSWVLALTAALAMLVMMLTAFTENAWADGEIKITYQTADTSAVCGETAEFVVVATGTGALKYQWQSRNGWSGAWANSGREGAQTPTLKVPALGGLNGWQFRCVITDGYGHTEYSETNTLTVMPTITAEPKSVYAEPGSVAKFSVTAAGAGAFTYQWQSRKDAACDWVNSGQAGARSATLSVQAKAGLNNWQFRCIVTDKNGLCAYSDTAVMFTQFAISSQPTDARATAGATAYFRIEAVGNGAMSYRWQSRKNASCDWVNSGQQGAKTAELAVATNAGLNGWQFRCVVTNENGQKKYSNVATLNIVPDITAQPKDTTVKAGNIATFAVKATGAAPLRYQWQSRKDASCDWVNSGQSGARSATLSVATNAGLNGWQFHCIVTDENGRSIISATATMTVK